MRSKKEILNEHFNRIDVNIGEYEGKIVLAIYRAMGDYALEALHSPLTEVTIEDSPKETNT